MVAGSGVGSGVGVTDGVFGAEGDSVGVSEGVGVALKPIPVSRNMSPLEAEVAAAVVVKVR